MPSQKKTASKRKKGRVHYVFGSTTADDIKRTVKVMREQGVSEETIQSLSNISEYISSDDSSSLDLDTSSNESAANSDVSDDDAGNKDDNGDENYEPPQKQRKRSDETENETGKPTTSNPAASAEQTEPKPSTSTATEQENQPKKTTRRKRTTPKKKKKSDEEEDNGEGDPRIIGPPIKNPGPNRRNYITIMNEAATDKDLLAKMEKQRGHEIKKAKLAAAIEKVRHKKQGEDPPAKKNKPHFRLDWHPILAYCKPPEVLELNLLAENYRYLDERHYPLDGNSSSRWDKHPYGLKRYVYEKAYICHPTDPEGMCDYCKDMSPTARKARWRLYKRMMKGEEPVHEPKDWVTLAQKVTSINDCIEGVKARGLQYEFFEHPSMRSSQPLPPKNLRQFHVSTQTYIAAAIPAVNYESDEWKNRRFYTDLTDKPKPGTYTKILDPNIHCERFMEPENAAIYLDKVKVQREFDPARYAMSRQMTMALRALEEKQRDQYRQAMELRAELLTKYKTSSAAEQREMLKKEPALDAFVYEYVPQMKKEQADVLMGRDTLEINVDNSGMLPKIPTYEKPPILQFQFDGQSFDANNYDLKTLMMYHERWYDYYVAEINKTSSDYVSPEIANDPDILAEQYAHLNVTTTANAPIVISADNSQATTAPVVLGQVVKQEPNDGGAYGDGQPAQAAPGTSTQTETQPTSTPIANTANTAANTTTTATITNTTTTVTTTNTTTTATATSTEQQDNQAQSAREPLVPTASADNVEFVAPLPAAETKLLAEELLRTAHIMVRHTPAGKALMAKREADRKANTVEAGENTPRQHLKWEYREKFLTVTKYLTDTHSDIQSLKLWDTPHFMLKPTDVILHRSPAMIQLRRHTARSTGARLREIERHVMAQDVKDWQDLDVYPTSNVNVSPYFADGFIFPAVPYLMTPRCRKYTYEQRDIHDNAGFTIRDVEILESLVKMMYTALNYAETAVTELGRIWAKDTTEAKTARELLVDACKTTVKDTQEAAIETFIHLLVTRRLRALKSDVHLTKDDVCQLLIGTPKLHYLY